MGILLGIDESESGRGTLTEQNAPASFLGQGTRQGISVCEAAETLLEEPDELVDV
jgi:hypothetical protein